MKTALLVALLIIVSGCASVRPWTTAEKVMLGASFVAAGADAYTTIEGLNNGCYETNVMVGEDPSNATVIGFAALMQLGFVAAAHYFEDYRMWILGVKTFVSGGCAVHNMNQY